MAVGSGGGGSFKLEKTWRSTGVGTQTFNSSGNITIPFGKYEILVSGRGQSGNPNTPGNIAGYNPIVPGNIKAYNAAVPSTISGYNPVVPGNATGLYNPGSGGNISGYNQEGGSLAGYNAGNPPTSTWNVSAYYYVQTSPLPAEPGNATGAYNAPSPGTANYNAPGIGTAYAEIYYYCVPLYNLPPGDPGAEIQVTLFAIVQYSGNAYNAVNNAPYTTTYQLSAPRYTCPAPYTQTNYSPYSEGRLNQGYNAPTTGTAIYNPPLPAGEYVALVGGPNYVGVYNSLPSPYTYSVPANPTGTSVITVPAFTLYTYRANANVLVTYNGTETVTPGNPGTAFYNAIYYAENYNPYVPGNQNYNSATGGTALYNTAIPSYAIYNAPTGQNANYNSPTPGNVGAGTNVLGINFPGGNVGASAPYVSPTRINRYAYPDGATYPVVVPSGAYVTIESK